MAMDLSHTRARPIFWEKKNRAQAAPLASVLTQMRGALLILAAAASADAAAVVELTEANFDGLVGIGADAPRAHFVEFFAPWCGHCKKLAPAWEELAQKLQDEAHPTAVGSVDATQHKELAVRFGVRGFPTLILFADGQMHKYKGSRAVEDLEAWVKGGYRSAPGEKTPTPPSAFGKTKSSLVDLFNAIVSLFEQQFAAALVMTAIAFFAGITVGFAGGLLLAPTPKPPPRGRPPAAAGEPATGAKKED